MYFYLIILVTTMDAVVNKFKPNPQWYTMKLTSMWVGGRHQRGRDYADGDN
jgi:hypothetical protein